MVLINGQEFELFNYQKTAEGVRLTVNNTTTAALESAIGEATDIIITDEYHGYNMKLSSIYKRYGNPIQHEIDFVNSNLEEIVQENSNELELQAGAISELAEMFVEGGNV